MEKSKPAKPAPQPTPKAEVAGEHFEPNEPNEHHKSHKHQHKHQKHADHHKEHHKKNEHHMMNEHHKEHHKMNEHHKEHHMMNEHHKEHHKEHQKMNEHHKMHEHFEPNEPNAHHMHHVHHMHYMHQGHHPAPKANAVHPVAKKLTKSHCESFMHRYVEVQAVDGYCYDGIVEHVDDEWVCLAVPGSVEPMRAFFPPPFFPPFGGGFHPFRPRRFNRLVLPLAGLAAISLLPYYW